MIVHWQNQVSAFVGAHRYLTVGIFRHLPQHVGVTTVAPALDAVPEFTIVMPERKTGIAVDRQWSIGLPERITFIVVDP